MSVRTQASINISALNHNVEIMRKIAPHSKILAMVKGNAYGHGLIPIGKKLLNVDAFGVACLSEAVKLREGGVQAPIVIMSGVFTEEDLHIISKNNLHIVIHEPYQVSLLEKSRIKNPIHIWLKIDTGMHRLGFNPAEFGKVYDLLEANPKVCKPLIVMTHLADADNVQKKTTNEQLTLFKKSTENLKCLKSIANSAGILTWPDSISDWNRPGISLYGVSPMLGKTGLEHGLRPVMTLKSKVVAIHQNHKGDALGYGGSWQCPENMPVATVAIGYGDGYPRHARNGTPTLINNVICPLVGTVSMDLLMVDIRGCRDTKIGDDVILWGDGLPAELVARYADTISYELLCSVSQRVEFVYV